MKLEIHKSEIIRLYTEEEYSLDKLIKIYHTSGSKIKNILLSENITLRSIPFKGQHTNHEYFTSIDSENKAYFLGYIFADGYHHEKTHTLSLQLHDKDIQTLETISQEIYNDYKPLLKIKNFDLHRFSVTSQQISKSLIVHGCTQNKTFKLTFPNTVPQYLIKHFIRGYMDGDGSIYFKKYNQSVEFIATESFCTTLNDIFVSKLNITPKNIEIKKHSSNGSIFRLRYCKRKDIITILSWLYSDSSIHLDRKYRKFLQIIEEENRPKKKNQYT